MTHPSLPDCCETFARITPSGSVQRWHSFWCKVSPNERIERISRAEIASHAHRHDWETCNIDDCLQCAYVGAHLDDEDDLRGRG